MTSVMLAASQIPDPTTIKWPMLGSPKLDGIRCHTQGGVLSRTDKPIPNVHIRNLMKPVIAYGLDGELMVNGVCHATYDDTQSAIMTIHGQPQFTYNVFDCPGEGAGLSFSKRWPKYLECIGELRESCPFIRAVEQKWLNNPEDLTNYMTECLEQGYEGVILKDPKALYKKGRSTLKQQTMLKYKYFHDDEAVIIGTYELMHNADTSTKKLSNQVPGNTLGGFIALWRGQQIDVGGGKGLTAELRKRLWATRSQLVGQLLTFKYQELTSSGMPRFPTYKGIRHAQDVGNGT